MIPGLVKFIFFSGFTYIHKWNNHHHHWNTTKELCKAWVRIATILLPNPRMEMHLRLIHSLEISPPNSYYLHGQLICSPIIPRIHLLPTFTIANNTTAINSNFALRICQWEQCELSKVSWGARGAYEQLPNFYRPNQTSTSLPWDFVARFRTKRRHCRLGPELCFLTSPVFLAETTKKVLWHPEGHHSNGGPRSASSDAHSGQ